MSDYVVMEVRCCCVPTKLYGTLRVPRDWAKRGKKLCLPVHVGVAASWENPFGIGDVESIDLTVEEFCEQGRLGYLALKYEGDDKPFAEKLARLRSLRGFTPAGVEAL